MANIHYLPKLYEVKKPLGILRHIVSNGETIFSISHQYYKHPALFQNIVLSNLSLLCDENGTPDIFHLPSEITIP